MPVSEVGVPRPDPTAAPAVRSQALVAKAPPRAGGVPYVKE